MRGIAIDPGPERSALVGFEIPDGVAYDEPPYGVRPIQEQALLVRNERALGLIRKTPCDLVAVERMELAFGRVGHEVMIAQFWAGRFVQLAEDLGMAYRWFAPLDRYRAVLGKASGQDPDLRLYLQYAYGGKPRCFGKPCPKCKTRKVRKVRGELIECRACKGKGWEVPRGPLWGWTGTHLYSALAVAVAVGKWRASLPQEGRDGQS